MYANNYSGQYYYIHTHVSSFHIVMDIYVYKELQVHKRGITFTSYVCKHICVCVYNICIYIYVCVCVCVCVRTPVEEGLVLTYGLFLLYILTLIVHTYTYTCYSIRMCILVRYESFRVHTYVHTYIAVV